MINRRNSNIYGLENWQNNIFDFYIIFLYIEYINKVIEWMIVLMIVSYHQEFDM